MGLFCWGSMIWKESGLSLERVWLHCWNGRNFLWLPLRAQRNGAKAPDFSLMLFRVLPEVHRKAARAAELAGKSLNQ
jgi:hypothetical protein